MSERTRAARVSERTLSIPSPTSLSARACTQESRPCQRTCTAVPPLANARGSGPLADARGSKCRFFAKIQPEVILKRLGAEGRGTRNFGFFLCPPLPFVVSSETAS